MVSSPLDRPSRASRHLARELRPQVAVVADEEAAQGRAACRWRSARLRGAGGGSVSLYCAMAPHMAIRPCRFMRVERGLQVLAADVVEVDVDAVRGGCAQRFAGPGRRCS